MKKIEDHIQFLEEMIKLQLWYVKHLVNTGLQKEFKAIINDETLIRGFTSLNKAFFGGVQPIRDDIWGLIIEEIEKSLWMDDENFIQNGLEVLYPFMLQRVSYDLAEFEFMATDKTFRSTSPVLYDVSDKDEKKHMELHFVNFKYPESFLSLDKPFVSEGKAHLLKMCQDAYDDNVKGIVIRSWTNSLPALLAIFPKEFKENEIKHPFEYFQNNGHMGIWGQFIKPDFTFNEFSAKYFKKYKKPYFEFTECRCSIDSLVKHLNSLNVA